MVTNINNADTIAYSSITAHSIPSMQTDGVGNQKETFYDNPKWTTYWGEFNRIPDLKASIVMKAIWTIGKGYTSDGTTEALLDSIRGWGKENFIDILKNMIVIMRVNGDSFAEIIRDPDTGELINLKTLDPGAMRIVVDGKGQIKRYEQRAKGGEKTEPITFQPDEILHFSHNRFADQIHGISDIESMEKIIIAYDENFDVRQRVARFQAVPFIIFKLKTDDPTKIDNFKTKIKTAKSNISDDMIIPDDDNLLSWEVVQVNPSSFIMEQASNLVSSFFRAQGLPLVIFGAAGSTESGSKMEYFAHEQVWEFDQKFVEEQLWDQLQIRIDLYPPSTMQAAVQGDESKDSGQGLELQQSDLAAGPGR